VSRRGILLVFLLISAAVAVSALCVMLLVVAGGAPPSIPSNATLYLKLRAPWAEIQSTNVLSQLTEQPPTLRETIQLLERAKRDSRITALVIQPRVEGALWGQLQEMRAALLDFRASGKPIVAHLEYGGPGEYLLASAADRVLLMPAGQLDLMGMATYELFFRGTLDKLGVYPDLLHIGDYKTASNTFTEKGFTPAHREMTKSLNHDFYDQLVTAVAEQRKRPAPEVKAALDGGPYLAETARRLGLVDALAYEDEIDDAAPVQGTRRLEAETYAKAVALGTAGAGAPRLALLYAVGTIASGRSSFDGAGGMVVGSETFNDWLRKVRVDKDVRAVVIRIDSPGGSAIASEVMWREIKLTRDVKPVVVSMGDVAASGGYYIAAPADVVVAEPGTITGSIGVVTGKFVLDGTLDKIGVAADAVSEGQFPEMYSPFKPFSKDERARIGEQMQTTYDLFVSRVAEGRKATPAKIDAVGQGRVWTGRQAHGLGLVDELGGLDRAVQIAKQRARLDPKQDVQFVVYPPKPSLLDLLEHPLGVTAAERAGVELPRPERHALQSALSMLRLFHRGESLTLMPNVFWR
jgi:protease-4